ncbi:DUF4334 domain-containing protein [Clostridium sp. BJN0013]|uniref:DUF4334 domain-containing protein n=1 Tax=Clostridium sp. BJN0013 TaxID=3236840 RepID=UPI0034C688C1
MDNREKVNQILKETISQEDAFAFYDSLEPVIPDEMWGLWKGSEMKTGHPFEGLLKAAGWYGKRFVNSEEVYPLIFEKQNGKLYAGNPTLIPITLPFDKIPHRIVNLAMKVVVPILSTNKSSARLREVNYRGKVTSAMVYDTKGIIDIFRKVDDNTLMGIMDIKGIKTDKSYFFILDRVQEGTI